MSLQEFRVDRAEAGTRLQDYLADRLTLSRRAAKALLDARHVCVNGRRVWMAGHALPAGATVTVLMPASAAAPQGVQVLYEDADFLIVDKPPGLLSNGPGSMEERLRQARADTRLMAAHRLDRDTSGCLLIARHPAALDLAIRLFAEHKVSKEYRAIVHGRLHPADQTLDRPLDGQPAITRVRTLNAAAKASHLTIFTLTGRTHQIRLHLAGIRHPVLGDREYGPKRDLDPGTMAVPRQMLHAWRLRLTHPTTGHTISVSSKLPKDFLDCLRTCGLKD